MGILMKVKYRVVADGTKALPYPATLQWEIFHTHKERELRARESRRDPNIGRHPL